MESLYFPLSAKEAEKAGVKYSSLVNRSAGFPTLLRKLRDEAGISQQKLADNIGVTKSTVGLYENGDNVPDVKTIYELAKFYGVSADYLLGLTDYRTPKTEIRAICEYTGLSQESVDCLIRWKTAKGIEAITRTGEAFILGKQQLGTSDEICEFHNLRQEGDCILRFLNRVVGPRLRNVVNAYIGVENARKLSGKLEENKTLDESSIEEFLGLHLEKAQDYGLIVLQSSEALNYYANCVGAEISKTLLSKDSDTNAKT